jgi:8-oxo-dGTP pyrophosphatase MutT (NUDIX family)
MNEKIKVFAYVVRTDRAPPGLLAFVSLDEPGFEVPKGAVEAGETLGQAALREIFEESGITGARIVRELGVTQWLDEEQHFFLLEAPPRLADGFEHVVTGQGIDAGFQYRYRWLEVERALSDQLVQGCDRFVEALLEACLEIPKRETNRTRHSEWSEESRLSSKDNDAGRFSRKPGI